MATSTRPWWLRLLLRSIAIFVGLVCALILLLYLFVGTPVWRDSTLACTQPEGVDYGDGDYSVFLLEPTFALTMAAQPTEALIGRSAGHGLVIALHAGSQIECRWTDDGVEIVESNGISHFVPADEFTGGR